MEISCLSLLVLFLPQGALPRFQPTPGTVEHPTIVPENGVPDVLAAAWSTDSVVRFDGLTGAFEGTFTHGGPLIKPSGLDFGPDGNLYVTSFYWSSVLEYDGRTGQYVGTFIPSNSGGLQQPSLIEFRPDGFLYVLSSYDGGVLRFDPESGAFHDVFIPSGAGGITTAFAMTFGPDGDIYLGGYYSKTVVRFNGTTGKVRNMVSQFINTPSGMEFGPDGELIVGEWRTGFSFPHNMQRFTPGGEFLGKTNLSQGPLELKLGSGERLFVAGASSIDMYDALSGQWLGFLDAPGVDDIMAVEFTRGGLQPVQ